MIHAAAAGPLAGLIPRRTVANIHPLAMLGPRDSLATVPLRSYMASTMNDTANLSLKALHDGVQRGEYVHVPNVPIFDEHDEYDWRKTLNGQANPNYGKLVRRYDRARLEQVANRNNHRDNETGSLALIGPGHTIPGGSQIKETDQPAPWGMMANYRVAPFGPGGKTGLLADHYVRKEHEADYRKTFPRRSIEIYYEGSPHQDLIDWCALLRRSSERDLGLVAYSADAYATAQQRFAPWEATVNRVCSANGKPLPAVYSRSDHKLRYSVEDNMPFPPNVDADPGVMPGAPPAAPPQSPGTPPVAPTAPASPAPLTPDEAALADRYMAHYMGSNPWMKTCAAQYGGAMPSATNTTLPAPAGPPPTPPAPVGPLPGASTAPFNQSQGLSDEDKGRMAREQEAGRYAKVQSEMETARAEAAAARQRESDALKRYQMAECEKMVIQLELGNHIHLDRAQEVEALLPLDEAGRYQRCEYIKKHYQRSITDPTILPTGDVPGDDIYQGLTRDRFKAVKQYSREHPGMSWDEAVSKCPK